MLRQLELELSRSSTDYIIDQQDSMDACDIRFIGNFDGEAVVWQAHIQTLRSYAHELERQPGTVEKVRLRQFIDIQKQQYSYQLIVGLNLNKIDEAAILRTIIMIRKYKRLHLGRHEYGEWIEF